MSHSHKEMIEEFELDHVPLCNNSFHVTNNGEIISSKQVGGSHYQNKIQPWEIIDSWGLNFYEGNILKYLLRTKENRVEDIKKLIHYSEKLLELEVAKC